MSSVPIWWPQFNVSKWAETVVDKVLDVLVKYVKEYKKPFIIRWARPDIDFGWDNPAWYKEYTSSGWVSDVIKVEEVPEKKAYILLGAVMKEKGYVKYVVVRGGVGLREKLAMWDLSRLAASGWRINVAVDVDPPVFTHGTGFAIDVYVSLPTSPATDDTEYLMLVIEEEGVHFSRGRALTTPFLINVFNMMIRQIHEKISKLAAEGKITGDDVELLRKTLCV